MVCGSAGGLAWLAWWQPGGGMAHSRAGVSWQCSICSRPIGVEAWVSTGSAESEESRGPGARGIWWSGWAWNRRRAAGRDGCSKLAWVEDFG